MYHAEDDEEVQRAGIVIISYNVDCPHSSFSFDYFKRVPVLTKALPLKRNGFHFCYDNPNIRPFMAATQVAIGKTFRLRFRAHCGTFCFCFLIAKANIALL